MTRVRWVWQGVGVVGVLVIAVGLSAQAAEHGGQEHGGTTTAPTAKEHGGTTQEHGGQEQGGQEHGGAVMSAEPSAEELRGRIADYVNEQEDTEGAFRIEDEVTGATRTLTLERVHERVGKTGDAYYSCTDMRDAETGELLDLDFDVEATEGRLDVVDVRIHKVNDQPRYTYDENDQRIPTL